MGCDIHFYVERKVDGNWVSPESWVKEYDDEPCCACVPWGENYYKQRNYNLFSILADVRNGTGFAGCDTGEGFNPIAKPRGLPDDCDSRIKKLSDQLDCDGHSHSHFTLAELLAYDWTQTTVLRGYVNAVEFAQWDRYRRGMGEGPSSYCGGVGGGLAQIIPAEDMERQVRDIHRTYMDSGNFGWLEEFEKEVRNRLPHNYAQFSWQLPYYKCAGSFWQETVPRLLQLANSEGNSYDDVRIVFWFDN